MKNFPEIIGKSLAQIQDLVDSAVEYGAKKLDEIDDSPSSKKQFENEYLQKTVDAGKGVLKGVGRIGTSYYKEYEKLKEEKGEKHL